MHLNVENIIQEVPEEISQTNNINNTDEAYQINNEIVNNYRKKISKNKKVQEDIEKGVAWVFTTPNLKFKKAKELKEKLKYNDIIGLILAFIGLALNIYSSNSYMHLDLNIYKESGVSKISIHFVGDETDLVFVLRVITTISTAILIFFLIRHYIILTEKLIYEETVPLHSTIYSTKNYLKLICEIIICLIHSPPGFNQIIVTIPAINGDPVDVDFDIFLSSLICLRAYLIFKYYVFNSAWADYQIMKICNDCNTHGGVSFAIKAELKENPYTIIILLLGISIIFFGYALRNVEIVFMQNVLESDFQDWRNIWNGFWCILISILTVGYGDYYPTTMVGRAIALIAFLWGTFLISLIVVSMTFSVEFSSQQEKSFNEIKKQKVKSKLNTYGMKFIVYSVEFTMLLKKYKELKNLDNKDDPIRLKLREELITKKSILRSTYKEFKNTRRHYFSLQCEETSENILYYLNQTFLNSMDRLNSKAEYWVNDINSKIDKATLFQFKLKHEALELNELTKVISQYIPESYLNQDSKSNED